MKKIKKLAASFLAAIVCFSLAGCAGSGQKKSFSEFCEEEFKDSIEADSFSAYFTVSDPSKYGITYDEYTLGDISLEELKNGEKEIKEERKKLYNYNRNELSEEEQITYDCLDTYYSTQQQLAHGYMMQNPFAIHSGLQANLSTNFIEYVFYNKDDVDHYLEYVKDVPRYVDQVCDFARDQSEKGYFMPDKVAELAADQCKQYLDADEDPLIESFKDKIKKLGLSKDEEEKYIKLNEDYVNQYFRPAYQTMEDLLDELGGTAGNQGGLAGFGDEGKKYYEAIVKYKTSSDYSVEEISNMLEKKASDILKEASALAIADYGAYDEGLNYQPDMDEPEEALDFLIDKMKEDFPEPATVNYNIEYQNKACEVEGTIAYYAPCRIDDIDVNNIKVNGSAVADSKMMLYTTLAHEGYPGHLYEFTSFYNNDEIPDIRKILDFIGATEGWAEYVSENALKYLDDLSENGAKMYALNDVLTYVVVSRLDIGVNYEGWDLDDAYDYLSAYFQTDKNYDEEDNLVSSLYYEVAGDPGAYLPYTLGHMFMNDMREKAEEELGDAFDAKEYHQWLLDVGVAPFNVYDSELDKWLAAKKQA